MDAWAYISVGVCAVQTGQYPDKNVIPAEGAKIRTEVLSVWPEVVNSKANGHTGKQKDAYSDKVLLVGKKEIAKSDGDISKP